MDGSRDRALRTALKVGGFLVAVTLLTTLFLYPSSVGGSQRSTSLLPPLDVVISGVWFTIQTITTTGYGLSEDLWTRELRIISIFLMIVAVPAWSILVTAVYDLYKDPRTH